MRLYQLRLQILTITVMTLCFLSLQGAQAERFNDTLEPNDANWSTTGNWVGADVADDNTEIAEIAAGDPVVDANFTVRELRAIFSTISSNIAGPGTITIDRNSATTALGFLNGSGQAAPFVLDGNITIDNTLEGRTVLRNSNSTGNLIRFDTNSLLTLETGLELQQGVGGTVEFNGQISGPQNLFFNSTNSSFGATADFDGGDLVFFGNASTVSNIVGGNLVDVDRKIQVNGNGSSIEINGAETFFGNIVVGSTHNFTFDVDASQSSMGFLEIADGGISLDVDASVSELAFADSSEIEWGTGSVSITGFQEDTIRFGTDSSGLTSGQLAAIDGGIYSLSSQGYLTLAADLLGDYNDDGQVDAADYTVWRDNDGSGTPLPNDNGLGTPIGAAHYSLWASNFGSSSSSSAATAVPEPGSLFLVLGCLAFARIKNR